ncbi:ribonuclease Z [Sulfolobus acidocaldarius]|uniref:Ribonuclease Z n=4 Tax=Sulfolobus acidocaldarius TaxID=2285 RepID=RNZ_SULAC|nr:ribonuclease Z [Sulfolobus acidocaldarius]Q4J9A4.1 RecName: Full=Ribonuclease Z; Short=RNase Z; AltName: Full=tRNA 3 endonuclease; AltName: Full=tRNase Z [Sulfolobus acidocaldarius DSM 639]AAY80626.1 metallo-beta-lactamase superfamily protein [Sulfolobus acidocaldarius DSM 639]AGE71218.1 ribonuclease Z [Sulfolobus acidocaldarius N8]AGE73488.1 ribonuclease Z [Sulfolobus acidocaldarius Ron12/I]ALU28524.1 ribonuclease Z [Sulfolobus acidocaldarius]ALU31233.1 ribonuclease Z [Sulfolobus acidocal
MFEIIFIGVGGGAPNKRGLPGILIRREGFEILLDCGEGTQNKMIEHSISFMKLNLIGISHLHGDHVLGLPGIIQTMAMYSRQQKLLLMGPTTLQDYLKSSSKHTYFKPGFETEFIQSYEDQNLTITTFRTCHTIESYGFLIKEKDKTKVDAERLKKEGITDWRIIRKLKEGKRVEIDTKVFLPEDYLYVKKGLSIAYTGDTAPCDSVLNAIKGVDLLIHDSTFLNEREAHDYGHSNCTDAAEIASKADVKRLALYHISGRYQTTEPLLKEAKKIFERTFLPEPLSYFILQEE